MVDAVDPATDVDPATEENLGEATQADSSDCATVAAAVTLAVSAAGTYTSSSTVIYPRSGTCTMHVVDFTGTSIHNITPQASVLFADGLPDNAKACGSMKAHMDVYSKTTPTGTMTLRQSLNYMGMWYVLFGSGFCALHEQDSQSVITREGNYAVRLAVSAEYEKLFFGSVVTFGAKARAQVTAVIP